MLIYVKTNCAVVSTNHITVDVYMTILVSRVRSRSAPSKDPIGSVSVKRRHSVFDAQNFGQNAQKRKTVRQVTQRIFR